MSDGSSFACRVCGHQGDALSWPAQERMLGLGHAFTYRACAACGCLQIDRVPDDLAPYYRDYYSNVAPRGLRARLVRWRDLAEAGSGHWLGALLARRWPQQSLRLLRPLLRDRRQHVLDIGCGEGSFLRLLQAMGFRHLTGIDPYTEAPTASGSTPHIVRGQLDELDGSFDLVFLHHTLEHMPDQVAALRAVRARLRPGALGVVRVPVVDGWAWRHYGPEWVQLDAPRHLYLHSRASLDLVARQAGLVPAGWAFDSTAFQFWGSEQYRLGHALAPPGSAGLHPKAGLFDDAQLRAWERAAHRLNEWSLGDQVMVVLQRADDDPGTLVRRCLDGG